MTSRFLLRESHQIHLPSHTIGQCRRPPGCTLVGFIGRKCALIRVVCYEHGCASGFRNALQRLNKASRILSRVLVPAAKAAGRIDDDQREVRYGLRLGDERIEQGGLTVSVRPPPSCV